MKAEAILLFILNIAIRIIGARVCSKRASKLNREPAGWGIFGFISPILAIIIVFCVGPLKPKTVQPQEDVIDIPESEWNVKGEEMNERK